MVSPQQNYNLSHLLLKPAALGELVPRRRENGIVSYPLKDWKEKGKTHDLEVLGGEKRMRRKGVDGRDVNVMNNGHN